MQRYFDAKEYDRYRIFKERHLGCLALTLTRATVECSNGVITVTDAAGNRGSMPYDNERKRASILAEIERGRQAERLQQEHVVSAPGYHERYGNDS